MQDYVKESNKDPKIIIDNDDEELKVEIIVDPELYPKREELKNQSSDDKEDNKSSNKSNNHLLLN